MARAAQVAMAAVLVAVAALPAASARDEADASSLRGDVLAVWHEPQVPAPHTQWHAFLRLWPGSNVTDVHYQVCRVGDACFAPPAPAVSDGNGTWSFDTTDYVANGRPVDYQAAWRLGVKWFLTERGSDGTESTAELPAGPALESPDCSGDAALSCSEQHYFVFTMGGSEAKPGPGPAWGLLVVAIGLLAWRRRPG